VLGGRREGEGRQIGKGETEGRQQRKREKEGERERERGKYGRKGGKRKDGYSERGKVETTNIRKIDIM
jgi:hypothetical protein